jgi:hypothetical protein
MVPPGPPSDRCRAVHASCGSFLVAPSGWIASICLCLRRRGGGFRSRLASTGSAPRLLDSPVLPQRQRPGRLNDARDRPAAFDAAQEVFPLRGAEIASHIPCSSRISVLRAVFRCRPAPAPSLPPAPWRRAAPFGYRSLCAGVRAFLCVRVRVGTSGRREGNVRVLSAAAAALRPLEPARDHTKRSHAARRSPRQRSGPGRIRDRGSPP